MISQFESKMEKAVDNLREEYANIRAGRANPHILDKKLAVVDLTATIMCSENKMPMYVFGLNEEDSIVKAMSGEFNGTVVTV